MTAQNEGEPKMMSREELEAIRERADKAYQGDCDWQVVTEYGSEGDKTFDVGFDRNGAGTFWEAGSWDMDERTAEFIAHARQDIPALLSHIEAQDAELATLRQLVDSSYVLREKPWRGLDKEDQP